MDVPQTPDPGRPRRQYRSSVERRREIIDATLEILAARGPRGWTTALLAERVGVAEATLFKHFPSKGDILVAAVTEHVDRTRAWMESFEVDGRGWPAVRQLLEGFFVHSVSAGGGPLVLLEQATRFPDELRIRLREGQERMFVRVRELLKGSSLEARSTGVAQLGMAILTRQLLEWLDQPEHEDVSPGAPPLQHALDLLGDALACLVPPTGPLP